MSMSSVVRSAAEREPMELMAVRRVSMGIGAAFFLKRVSVVTAVCIVVTNT